MERSAVALRAGRQRVNGRCLGNGGWDSRLPPPSPYVALAPKEVEPSRGVQPVHPGSLFGKSSGLTASKATSYTELPAEPQEVPSRAQVRVLRAKLVSGEEVVVPRANVELL